MSKRLAFMLAVALGAGGACAGSGTAHVGYAGSGAVTIRSSELVSVDDDVYVLADADEPVFYADDYYWLYRGDRWYRSSSYDRGDWTYVSTPAPRLRRINQPTAYARYRSHHQEARNTPRPTTPAADPWRDSRDRRDAPTTVLPPREQQPYQPVQPPQPATPYPRPPQGESPVRDQHVTPPARDIKVVPPREDRARPNPPPARVDDRDNDRRGNTAKDNRGHDDDKDKDRRDNDKKDKKHDH